MEKEITQTDKAAVRTMDRLVAKLKTSINALVADDEQLDRQVALLKTIPGIDLDSACKIMA